MKKCKRMIASLVSMAILFTFSGTWLLVSAETEVTPWMFYTFDDETGTDSGTAKNDATVVGTPVFGSKTEEDAGPEGKYMSISSDSYFTAPADAFDFGTQAFTISFWAKFAADYGVNLGERFFQTGLWGAGDTGFVISLNRDGGGNASINAAVAGTGEGNDFAGTWGASSFNVDYFDGNWHLITVAFDQPNKKYYMYLDGTQVAVKVFERDNLSADNNRQNVGLGVFCLDDGSLPAGAPNYMLDDVAFYKVALTADQISAYYEANKGNTQAFDPDAEATLTDALAGISITGVGLDGAALYASTVMSGSFYNKLTQQYNGFENFILYDVSLEREDLPVELSENVSVRIDVPNKLADKTGLKIVIAAQDDALNVVDAQLVDGQMRFQTKTFGQIAIVFPNQASSESPDDSNNSDNSDNDDLPKTGSGTSLPLVALSALAGAGILLSYKTSRKCK